MRVCTKCETSKPTDSFTKNSRSPDGIGYMCKECRDLEYEKTKHSIDRLFSVIYSSQKANSKTREHKEPAYTKKQLREWVEITNKDKFDKLLDNWIESGYKKMYKPSVDRLDDSKGYTLDNIQLVTFQENVDKQAEEVYMGSLNANVIPVYQYDEDGIYVNSYSSATAASRATGQHRKMIKKACDGVIIDVKRTQWRLYKTHDLKVKLETMIIDRYTKDGMFVDSWFSPTKAGEATGAKKQAIIANYLGKTKSAGGYVWVRRYVLGKVNEKIKDR